MSSENFVSEGIVKCKAWYETGEGGEGIEYYVSSVACSLPQFWDTPSLHSLALECLQAPAQIKGWPSAGICTKAAVLVSYFASL